MIDLAEDQGFSVLPLIGGTGMRVMPKPGTPAGISPVVLYKHGGGHELRNREQALKRLGLKLPGNYTPPKTRQQQEEASMVVTSVARPPLSKFENVREKVNAVLDAVADLDKALSELEAEHKKLMTLQDAIRGLSS
jgi:hypothetical protein